MVIQIDVDGTITRAPEFFAWLTQALRRDGHTVLVVTSRTTSPENVKITAEELRGFGIVYDKLILSPEVADLDPRRIPHGLHPAHRIYVSKLIAAQDYGVQVLYDDCSLTNAMVNQYLPDVIVFCPIRKR